MIDRQQLEAILSRRFAGAPLDQIAAAANAIMGLDREAPANRPAAKAKGASASSGEDTRHEVAPALPHRQA